MYQFIFSDFGSSGSLASSASDSAAFALPDFPFAGFFGVGRAAAFFLRRSRGRNLCRSRLGCDGFRFDRRPDSVVQRLSSALQSPATGACGRRICRVGQGLAAGSGGLLLRDVFRQIARLVDRVVRLVGHGLSSQWSECTDSRNGVRRSPALWRTALSKTRRRRPSTTASKKIMTSTTIDARINSARLGHETLFISASTAIRKSANAGTLTIRYAAHNPASNNRPGKPVLHPHDGRAHLQHRAQPPEPQRQGEGDAANVTCRVMRPWLRL